MAKGRKAILIVAAVVVVACIAVLAVFFLQTGETEEEFGALADACRGRAVAGTAEYQGGAGIHRAMGIGMYTEEGNLLPYPYAIPEEARAEVLGDVELVLCLKEKKEVLLERCPYGDEDEDQVEAVVERYRFEQEVSLVEASTGEVVATEVLVGDDPRECLDKESFPNGAETLRVEGDEVSNNDIQEWARAYLIVP